MDAPKDLMNKFVDTLARLPNLRTLELLSVSRRGPVTAGLKRKCANFPSIREMAVNVTYPDFIRSCPNLEGLTRAVLVISTSTTTFAYNERLNVHFATVAPCYTGPKSSMSMTGTSWTSRLRTLQGMSKQTQVSV